MSFFLIVIKTQTTSVYIDLIPFRNYILKKEWGANTNLDNNNDSNRTNSITFSINSVTQFTTIPSGLVSRHLTTSFRMYPDTSSG
jgi:hypothetical protein